jgi:hypothetical protein
MPKVVPCFSAKARGKAATLVVQKGVGKGVDLDCMRTVVRKAAVYVPRARAFVR